METGPRVAHAVSWGTCATSAWLRDGAAHGDVAGCLDERHRPGRRPLARRCCAAEAVRQNRVVVSITPLRHIAQTTASCGMARFRGQCFVEMAPAAHPLRRTATVRTHPF